MTRRRCLLLAAASGAVAGLSLALAGAAPAAERPVAQAPTADRPAGPGHAAERVVIAGGDLTEIAFALGAGERLVGVDSTSTHPAEARALPQIGYARRLTAEGLLALRPDLVIAAHDAGPETALDRLSTAGIEVLRAPEADEPGQVAAKIAFMGRALGLEDRAEALAETVGRRMAEVAAKVARLPEAPRVLFVLSVEGGAPVVAGEATAADAMIRLAGGRNAAVGFEGYRPMGREAILAAAPDALLMMEGHADRLGGVGTVLARPEIAATPAGRAGRTVTMDGTLLLGFGPRTPEAVARLAAALQPVAAGAAGL